MIPVTEPLNNYNTQISEIKDNLPELYLEDRQIWENDCHH